MTTLLHEARISGAAIEPAPGGSFSVASSRRGPGPSVSHIAQASVLATPLGECAAPITQPPACLLGQKIM